MHLFDLKVAPTVSYGIKAIWEKLSKSHLETLNEVKARFFRRVFGLYHCVESRYVFLIANEPLFVEDLVERNKLPTPNARDAAVSVRASTRNTVDLLILWASKTAMGYDKVFEVYLCLTWMSEYIADDENKNLRLLSMFSQSSFFSYSIRAKHENIEGGGRIL